MPVDFKYSTSNPHKNHLYQLLGYAIILEDLFNCTVNKGFVYLIPNEDAFIFDLSNDLKLETKEIIQKIRQMISSQQMPQPAELKNKCLDCEYRNFCGDIF
ncbi:MAG: CRISPR-associated protein Cas4 [Nitrospirota bacterium]